MSDVLDVNALRNLRSVIGGDIDDLMELVEEFVASLPHEMDAMRGQAENGDLTALRITAHSCKSNARDLGAPGLVIPMIQSVEEAEQAVAATRYPPHGVRGFAGASRATKFGRIKDYVARVEDETAVILQLETRAAIEQAEAIGAVEGINGIFFGPADIAADIGKVGQPMDPEVWALVKPAAQKLIAMGVPVGTLVLDPAFATELLNEGFTFVACATDAALLAKASDGLLADVTAGLK